MLGVLSLAGFFIFAIQNADAAAGQAWTRPPGASFDAATEIAASCTNWRADIEAVIGDDDFTLYQAGAAPRCGIPFKLLEALLWSGRTISPGEEVYLCLSDGQVTGVECRDGGDSTLIKTKFSGTSAVGPSSLPPSPASPSVSGATPTAPISATADATVTATAAASNAPIPTGAPASATASAPLAAAPAARFSRALARGDRGEDVRRLQEILARDPALYPEGIVSGFFGALTERAVQRFQMRHGIVSSGTPATTGFGRVGPRTIIKLNEFLSL